MATLGPGAGPPAGAPAAGCPAQGEHPRTAAEGGAGGAGARWGRAGLKIFCWKMLDGF